MSLERPKLFVVIPAAGVGRRFKADKPKQYQEIFGQTVLEITLDKLRALNADAMVIAINPKDQEFDSISSDDVVVVEGGEDRRSSVLSALSALEGDEQDLVLVHDAVRPCVRIEQMSALIEIASGDPVGGLLAVPVTDTLKRVAEGRVLQTEDRSTLWQAQTPQVFRMGLLKQALQNFSEATDEASAVEALGLQPRICLGRSDNIKITLEEDLTMARLILAGESM